LGLSFKVRRDHQSLKFLLEHKARTVLLQRWVLKLLEYDFVIECKKGKENRVANALSRKFEESTEDTHLTLSLISFPIPTWVEELKDSYLADPITITKAILIQLQQGQGFPKGYTLPQRLILKKGRLYIVKD
jgi:aminopeptidase N